MIFKLKTSSETMKIFEEIGAVTHLQPFALCKIAIALSLHNKEEIDFNEKNVDSEGLELNRQTITGDYDDLFKALVINNVGKPLTDEEYFPKYLKYHIDRGARMLFSEFKYSNENFYVHLTKIDEGI